MKRIPLFLLGLWLALGPGSALAGRLVLDLQAQAETAGEQLNIRLGLTNRGDEAARNLRVETLHPDESGRAELAELLPGRRVQLLLRLPRPEGGPGRQAWVGRVRFEDLNRRPFSALAWAEYFLNQDRASRLVVRSEPVDLESQAEVTLHLINPEERAFSVKATFFSPLEMAAEPVRQHLMMLPRAAADLSFRLVNLGALGGAGYPLLVLLEHESQGLSTAKPVEVLVRVRPRENLFRRHLGWWLAGVGLLLAGFVLARLRRRS